MNYVWSALCTFLSSASHAVDALAKGANTNRSFVSDQPKGQILRCLKSRPWARQDTGEVTCLQWEWIDLDTGGNRHRIRKTLRGLVPWAVLGGLRVGPERCAVWQNMGTMFGRHSALFLSSASHAVDALAKGANTNRSFVSNQPKGQILRCLKSRPWARQDTGEVTCLQWEWIDLDTGGNRHRIRKTLRGLVPWAVRLWACASYGFARTEQQTMAAVV